MLDHKYFIHENKIAKVLEARSIVKDYNDEYKSINYHVTYGKILIKHVILTYLKDKLVKVNGEISIFDIEKLMRIE